MRRMHYLLLTLALGLPATAQEVPSAPESLPETPGLTLTPPPTVPQEATLSADSGRWDETTRQWTGAGNVVIIYRTYVLKADEAVYDDASQTATLRGNVTLDTGKNVIIGEPDAVLEYHFRNRAWTFTHARTELQYQGITEPVRISASSLSGNRTEIQLRNVSVTTCDPQFPQYSVSAREITLIPNQRLIARNATTSLFGKRLVTLPALVLPIRRESAGRPPLVPTFGQSLEEGLFVKTSLNYAAGTRQSGSVLVDLMQKKGVGLGIRHDYPMASGNGTASVYGVLGSDSRNLTAHLRHQQQWLGFDTVVNTELRRNSYMYLPGSTSRNLSVAMNRAAGSSDTSLALRWDSTSGSTSAYENLTTSLNQAYRYNARGTARLGVDFSSQSASLQRVKELATRVDVTQGMGSADLQFSANRLSTLGTGASGFFRPVQRLPELTVRSDAYRLGLTNTRSAPLRFLVSSGHFEANEHAGSRQLIQVDAPTRSWTWGSTKYDASGGFRQAVYSSDAAQYTLTSNLRVAQPISRRSDLSLSWNYQKPRGYSPFQFDRPFAYNSLLGSVRLAEWQGLEVRAGTGYDFENDLSPWRDLQALLLYQPGQNLRFTTNVAVNVNGRDAGQQSSVRYVNNALRWRAGAFHLDAESRFLPNTGRFGRMLANLNTPLAENWSLHALFGKDSGQRYRRIMLTHDLGCLEASVAAVDDRGWREERGVRFMLRIKAFPVAEAFSTGMFGENLDIGAPDITYGGVADGSLSTPGL